MFKESLIVLINTPIYAFIIGIEIWLSAIHNKDFYGKKDTLTNIYLTSLNGTLDVLLRTFTLWIYVLVAPFAVVSWGNYDFLYWFMLFLAEDLAYYWLHRIDHHSRFFWAIHVTHHSSEKFNLTTGFRSSVFQPLYRFIYFTPLILLGFKPLDIPVMYSITQIYGILVHTQWVKKLPNWIEYIFVTPSHHRVHHASNIPYLDKNLGQALIIWDRFFGTFEQENIEKHGVTVYGLTKDIEDKSLKNTIFHEWIAIYKDISEKNISFKTKLNYLFRPPGWSHDGSRDTSVTLQEAYRKKNEQY